MAVQHMGYAGNLKVDQVVQVNHREMKLKLHRASTRFTRYRIQLNAYGDHLVVKERLHGCSWTVTENDMPEAMRRVLTEFLAAREDHSVYYLYTDETEKLIERLRRSP